MPFDRSTRGASALSSEAVALVTAARAGLRPSSYDRQRVSAALCDRLCLEEAARVADDDPNAGVER